MRLTPLVGHPEGCPYRASFVGTQLAVSANRVNYFVRMALNEDVRHPMRPRITRTNIVFAIFGLLVAGLIVASQFTRSQPPIELTVAVDPMIEAWVQDAASQFNADANRTSAGAPIRILVTTMPDVRVWQNSAAWTQANHPNAWIPLSSASVGYAPASLAYTTTIDSLARTPLLWGGFRSLTD